MSYENAPATALLSTNCACCGRALVDAVSVETGVGPDCREKYGYGEAQGEAQWGLAMMLLDGVVAVADVNPELSARDAVNKLVHLVARRRADLDVDQARAIFGAIHALGFTVLADRIAKRFHETATGAIEEATSAATADNVEELRKAYAKIRFDFCYDNCSTTEFDALVKARDPKSPVDWVRFAEEAQCTCKRCAGSGHYIRGYVNGRPNVVGECFRCAGKGRQTLEDARRNRAHDRYSMNRSTAA